MNVFSIIFDIIIVLVVVLTARMYGKKGFVACVLSFVGFLAAILISLAVSTWLAPSIFNSMFRDNMETQIMSALNVDGVNTINDMLVNIFGFLPAETIQSISGEIGQTVVSATPEVAENIVDTIIKPMVVPIISFVIFIIVFIVIRIVLSILARMFRGVNSIPVIGAGNKALGFVFGVAIGLLYAFLLLCFLWGIASISGSISWIQQILNGSFIVKLAAPLNPFLVNWEF